MVQATDLDRYDFFHCLILTSSLRVSVPLCAQLS